MRVLTPVMLVVVMVVVVMVMVEGSSMRGGSSAYPLREGLKLVNNGYDGVVVKVDDRFPESWCNTILDRLEVSTKSYLTFPSSPGLSRWPSTRPTEIKVTRPAQARPALCVCVCVCWCRQVGKYLASLTYLFKSNKPEVLCRSDFAIQYKWPFVQQV
ncbi:hypothetical protein E2C01_075830 [Portunus trituberculatus]|uniref:Uncharacterized protein n=1 Tax=Portunus trituberculatus TaxID=210409 RepID=A0A5B7IFZ6_PORTR|nr:hypothetical protein [Portunus trituberculatus]